MGFLLGALVWGACASSSAWAQAPTTVTWSGIQCSKSTFSEDFKTMTVENDFSEPVGGNAAGKSTESWTRK